MADYREASVGIEVAKPRTASRLQKLAEKERFASLVRSSFGDKHAAGS